MLDVGGQGLCPARLALPRPAVLPLLRERPVHPLRLAVLSGSEGPGADVADAPPGEKGVEVAAAVARAVVGHHALDGDAQAREEGEAPAMNAGQAPLRSSGSSSA